MKNTIKLVSVLIMITLISVTALVVHHDRASSTDVVKEKSDQEKAEEYVEKMKPEIEKHLHKRDIHNFIKTITFEKDVTINPMGDIFIGGYINDEPERFGFDALLMYESGEVDSMSYDPDLSDRFIDWEEYKD